MAERFFPMKLSSGDENHRRENLTLLLSGPISSGKTSMLFQFALNVANASSHSRVVFICHREKIESNPPFLSQGIDPSSDVFNRIHMKYVDDDEGIRKYFAAFHLHGDDDSPSAVIIDDFGDYFSQLNSVANSRVRDMAMVRTLALCHNAIVDAKKGFCELVISETNHIWRRFPEVVVHLQTMDLEDLYNKRSW